VTILDRETRETIQCARDQERRHELEASHQKEEPRKRRHYSRALGDEVYRQHIENLIPAETIAELIGISILGVRKMLSCRSKARRYSIHHSAHCGLEITVPAKIERELGQGDRYVCELTVDGFAYRRVSA
jgi:hypothetical protein